MSNGDYLFSRHGTAHAVQEHERHHLHAEIANIEANRLLNTNIDALTQYFVEKYQIDVPDLDEGGMQVDQQEARRDVSRDPNRLASILGSGPAHVTGTEVTIEVPFSGDAELFHVQPSTFTTNAPHDRPGSIGRVRAQLDRWLAELKRHLQWHRDSFSGFNQSLPGLARSAITQRRDKSKGWPDDKGRWREVETRCAGSPLSLALGYCSSRTTRRDEAVRFITCSLVWAQACYETRPIVTRRPAPGVDGTSSLALEPVEASP